MLGDLIFSTDFEKCRARLRQTSSLLRADVLLASHVGLKHAGNPDPAIGLLVQLEDRIPDPGAGEGCIVQGVTEMYLAVLIAVTQIETARLEIMKARGAVGLTIALP